MSGRLKLGVCTTRAMGSVSRWQEDAARMAALGIRLVRIGEFAWSRIEPEPGRFEWEWLDRAIATLASAGLQVVLGTPDRLSAEMVSGLVSRHPRCRCRRPSRGFGSRRHYCFSNETYRRESSRIVTAVAGRYGHEPAVVRLADDNEYGCHDTSAELLGGGNCVASAAGCSNATRDIGAPERRVGVRVLEQEYRSFDAIELPVGTVTEANPAHRLDFWRYSSQQVATFNREQVEDPAPARRLAAASCTMFMGFSTDFDHTHCRRPGRRGLGQLIRWVSRVAGRRPCREDSVRAPGSSRRGGAAS